MKDIAVSLYLAVAAAGGIYTLAAFFRSLNPKHSLPVPRVQSDIISADDLEGLI